jgi:hypothetical protein
MKFEFHPLAFQELDDSVKYYENIREGLGLEFLDEVDISIKRIIQFPTGWTKVSKFCRRCLVRRFPYGIIYQNLENKIFIIAIMQLNRKPDYWKDRVKRE